MAKNIIFVPAVDQGSGSGHLRRSLKLSRDLKGLVYIDQDVWISRQDFFKGIFTESDYKFISHDAPEKVDLIIFDQRNTSDHVWNFWQGKGPVLMLDEGSSYRSKAPILWDSIPPYVHNANIQDISPLSLTFQKQSGNASGILVSFGGEDPASLTRSLIALLMQNNFEWHEKVTIILPSSLDPSMVKGLPDDWNILPQQRDLKKLFPEYKTVITSFGLTALEALASGCGVLLINPSAYHEKLSRQVGFSSLGVGLPKYRHFISRLKSESPSISSTQLSSQVDFVSKINNLNTTNWTCPNCGGHSSKVLQRYVDKSYFECSECSFVYMYRFSGESRNYSREYFFEDYQKQYGKTYVEDFDHIYDMGVARVKIIQKYFGKISEPVLDIGCAFGPFLKALKDSGINGVGLDISEEAVAYVLEQKIAQAWSGDILNWESPFKNLGGITMWYVIEHFPDLKKVLDKVSKLVKVGGFFAFSTPSGGGISRMTRERDFFKNSPDDHFTIWEPKKAKKILLAYGFQVKKIRVTGHHPERFPGLFGSSWLGQKIALMFSHLFGWGDTFEVYAERIHD